MGLIKKIRKYITGKRLTWPIPFKEDRSLEEIYVRDPYIIFEDDTYYLIGTTYRLNFNDSYGVLMYKSKDLKTFSGPYMILEKSKLNVEYKDFWAPEIHKYKDKYLLLVTLTPKGFKRGTYLFASDSIMGEYKMCSRVTEPNASSLDGTFLEENGKLYITYCYGYEETNDDGKIARVELKEDLSGIDYSTKVDLFRASANPYRLTKKRQKVTDGPFYFKHNNELYLLWATNDKNEKYIQLVAKSDNGSILGNFTQLGPIYTNDGGHGMIFKNKEGRNCLILHVPNKRTLKGEYEHPIIIEDITSKGIFR